jgi:uncharacterized protein YcfL
VEGTVHQRSEKRMLRRLMGMCVLASLAVAGCTGPISAEQDGIQLQEFPQVTVTGYWLQQNIRVQQPVASHVGNGQLKIVMPVRRHTDFDLSLDYQFTFLDKNGIQVEQPGWQYIRIPRKGIAQIECTSMLPADDFRVLLRYRK